MKVEQIYTGCLAEAAYYIESNGEAAIIDPLRETAPYLKKAEADGSQIKYIFETHFHADFVSGHVDLAKETGAEIIYGPNAEAGYKITVAKDGQDFKLGNITLRVLHTPGHTMESSTILLLDESGREYAIFSGDTLFIGDVGRPDLAVKTNLSQADLASHLFDSLRNKIMTLPDEVLVYPAHGAGSACGKNLSKETFSTLGLQKKTNYALRADMSREEFIKEVTDGLMPPPQYFPKNAMMNKMGYDAFDSVLEKGTVPLDVDTFEAMANHEGALVLDTRTAWDFSQGHIPNSVFIGIDGSFAPWVGALITDLKQPMILITDPGREEEVVTRLSRVGYDNTLGYLEGGFEAWKNSGKEFETMDYMSAVEFAEMVQNDPSVTVIDVRKPTEYEIEHLEIAQNFPLDFINENMNNLDRNQKYYVHCAGGYRSMIACSILQARGYDVHDVNGGYKELQKQNLPTLSERAACGS
ncbi:MAG: MBL fold metallo-hydrolase [Bacteroidia bacterium]|nr:MBL fold metallo-hydrolase [Bacteroidia bacterium]